MDIKQMGLAGRRRKLIASAIQGQHKRLKNSREGWA
jgi:hypothetical protein